jgi:hypothetical protein
MFHGFSISLILSFEYPDKQYSMKVFFAAIAAALIFASCASFPPPETAVIPEQEVPEQLESLERIMGKGTVPEEQLAAFLLQTNAKADGDFVRQLSVYYVEEAAAEGVNHDTAFAQMCLETGFLRYGGLVTPDMNNFCGLGAIGPGQTGHIFPDARSGVRAHIQHLQAYASVEPLNQDLIDPRYYYVKRGSSPTIQGLAGTWAADMAYSEKIGAILQRLYEFACQESSTDCAILSPSD